MAPWLGQISSPLCNCFLCPWRLNISLALFFGLNTGSVHRSHLLGNYSFWFCCGLCPPIPYSSWSLKVIQDTVLWGLANVKQGGKVTSQTLHGILLFLDFIVVFAIFTATWHPWPTATSRVISSSRLLSKQLLSVLYSIADYSSLSGVSCPCPYLFLISF